MSGHSKWANIKHRKGRQDAARGKLFAKLIRAIEAAARQGGSDITANATLATAVQKAKDNSVPKDNIDRAIAAAPGKKTARFMTRFGTKVTPPEALHCMFRCSQTIATGRLPT